MSSMPPGSRLAEKIMANPAYGLGWRGIMVSMSFVAVHERGFCSNQRQLRMSLTWMEIILKLYTLLPRWVLSSEEFRSTLA